MYEGTLIRDLFALVEGTERNVRTKPTDAESVAQLGKQIAEASASIPSQSEKLAEPLGLSAADRDLGLLLVVHAQLIGAFEPGDNFLDAIDVYQVRAVGAPE